MALEANVLVGSVKSGDMYGDFEHFTGTGQKPYQAKIIRCKPGGVRARQTHPRLGRCGRTLPTLSLNPSCPFHSAPPSPPSPRRFNYEARLKRAYRGAD